MTFPFQDYERFLNRIKNDEVRNAFVYLVDEVVRLGEYKLVPIWKGKNGKNSVDFEKNGKLYFAFIVNVNEGLLFYIKRQELKRRRETGQNVEDLLEYLGNYFSEVGISNPDAPTPEITVRVNNIEEARTAIMFVYGLDLEVNNPDEIQEQEGNAYFEGTVTSVCVDRYERNPKARQACLTHYGYGCRVCNFDFEETYGEIGKHFVEVHHLVELSTIDGEHEVNPKEDLVPVCANCHAMLHRRKPAYSIEELQDKMK